MEMEEMGVNLKKEMKLEMEEMEIEEIEMEEMGMDERIEMVIGTKDGPNKEDNVDEISLEDFVSFLLLCLFDVAPSTLDTSYAIELADGRISETNIVLRGCTYLEAAMELRQIV
ncbi:hypothetical protein Tco_0469758 [Tanacetum coccineum]